MPHSGDASGSLYPDNGVNHTVHASVNDTENKSVNETVKETVNASIKAFVHAPINGSSKSKLGLHHPHLWKEHLAYHDISSERMAIPGCSQYCCRTPKSWKFDPSFHTHELHEELMHQLAEALRGADKEGRVGGIHVRHAPSTLLIILRHMLLWSCTQLAVRPPSCPSPPPLLIAASAEGSG